jgi:hypothetical protein
MNNSRAMVHFQRLIKHSELSPHSIQLVMVPVAIIKDSFVIAKSWQCFANMFCLMMGNKHAIVRNILSIFEGKSNY